MKGQASCTVKEHIKNYEGWNSPYWSEEKVLLHSVWVVEDWDTSYMDGYNWCIGSAGKISWYIYTHVTLHV